MKPRTGVDRSITQKWRPATQAIRGGTWRSDFGETSEALFLTSGFSYESADEVAARFRGEAEGFTYSRQTNPTVSMFEERMALLEGAEVARATGTGMAAMATALLCQLRAGDHVVAARALFGSCRWLVDTLLPQYGIETTIVDGRDNEAWAKARKPNTKVFFLETPANPTLDIVDLRAVSDLAHEIGAKVVVDNVFATPVLQKPMELGADIVCYSATKHIDGQGRVLGGVILCDKKFDDEHLYAYFRHTGQIMSAFNAWVLLKGLETLDMRVRRMCENAAKVADFLAGRVPTLLYPGRRDFPQHALAMQQMAAGGTILSFHLESERQAFDLLNALELIDISNNIGDSRSLATHPATTTHKAVAPEIQRELGITPGMIRLSVGLEDPQDVIEDLDRALKILTL
ncbi:O-succinylhomoserine sulfhydrylase [Pedomonas sp. V897]|uniref:O-succinylhomoserine sulfhydrylase n=1 Tax=Pedomonas sp. V897 TaxID=3446482 RepID=UPI003EE08AC7